MMLRRGLVCSLVVLALACSDEGPPTANDIGDPCRPQSQFCVAHDILQVCVDDAWTQTDCDSVCLAMGPSWVADGCESPWCKCVPSDPWACTPDARACVDDETVQVCSDLQVWEPSACADVCAGQALESLGCITDFDLHGQPTGDCWCTLEGTACDPQTDADACVDTTTLGRCEAGVWVFEDCTQTCSPTGTCEPSTAQCQC